MTGLIEVFPDIEKALMDGLPPRLAELGRPGVGVGDSVPDDAKLAAFKNTGFLRISLLDDPDNAITRIATVDIDCFAGTRSVAYDVSKKVRGILLSSRSLGGVTIDLVSTTTGPKRVPWDNANVRRLLSTYRISTRR
jgi:hypothetical protein